MTRNAYQALKAEIKAMFDLLTYKEQEQIIELIKSSRTEHHECK